MKSKTLKKKVNKEPPLDIIYEKYPKHKLLTVKDIIQRGDQYLHSNSWYKTELIGHHPSPQALYRRRLSRESSLTVK